jgi:mycothiol synthase
MPLPCRTVLSVRATPDEVGDQLAATDAVRRLTAGDDLDRTAGLRDPNAETGAALLGAVITEAAALGAETVELQATAAGEAHGAMAEANGMTLTREVLRVGRDLPVGEPWSLAVRPFRVGEDEAAWLEVNNRAFAWHPDQGGWTRADIEAREAEPWFDPEGFLVHEHDGRIAAFCWTKVHASERPPLGEIYVIGVDPDAGGRGIGRAIVLAGLDHLAGRGLRDAILYVESTNTVARRLYDHLGFTTVWTDRWWTRIL